jgi:hypothetical protein
MELGKPNILRRGHAQVAGLVALACCAGFLAGCGSSGGAQALPATTRACQEVSAVLSDGPDPGADPVGYAEAQILPLRQVHTSDSRLRTAIEGLDRAYQQMFSTDGAAAARRAVTKASDRINAICPGAAP